MRLVRLKHSPNWYVEWREQGAKKRVSTGTDDPVKADGFLKEFRLAYTEDPADKWPDVPSVLNWYYEQHASKKASASQANIAKRHLVGFFGSTLVCDCKISRQERYVEHRRAKGVSDATIARELSVLSAAFERAKKYEKLPAEPPTVHMPPPAPPRERFLTRDEAARLLRQLRKNRRQRHLLLFTRLALYTGARSGAILALTWDRVMFDLEVIDYALPGVAQTNKRSVASPLPPHMRKALERAHRAARTPYVIEWGGQPVDRIIRAFRRQAKLAGLDDVTPHTLRHTFATWAGNNGAPVLLLARQLGHARTSTTERYAKRQVEAQRVVQKAARARKRGNPGASAPIAPSGGKG